MISATICCSSSPFVTINLKGLNHRSSNNGVFFVGNRNRGFCSTSTRVFSRRPKPHSSSSSSSSSSSKKGKRRKHNDVSEEDGIDEDALEAFFSQLEKDLNIDLSDDGCDEELSEEDLARLGKELEEAFADEDEEIFNSSDSEVDDDDNDDDDDYDDDNEDHERPIQLKNWQLRRLASALKIGRRKTSIKSLAAELCLDRTLVLKLLRDPPPNLLLLSAALPDKVEPANLELETEIVEPSPPKAMASTVEPEPEVSEPVHVMQKRWSMQKRLKKVQVETLERVYKRSKRPTNAMISSIVHVTNLPKKRIVQWFEEKRAEEGVPDDRRPYHRSSDTVFTNKSL